MQIRIRVHGGTVARVCEGRAEGERGRQWVREGLNLPKSLIKALALSVGASVVVGGVGGVVNVITSAGEYEAEHGRGGERSGEQCGRRTRIESQQWRTIIHGGDTKESARRVVLVLNTRSLPGSDERASCKLTLNKSTIRCGEQTGVCAECAELRRGV